MKKVVNASVGGRGFALDEDAYARLSTYFKHFRSRLSKDDFSTQEIMSDLESRIAELFDQETGGATYRVVDYDLVNKVVTQLGMPDGSPEPFDSAQGGAFDSAQGPENSKQRQEEKSAGADFSYAGSKGEAPKRLYRDPDNKTISGVCAGLAAFLNIDITIVRIIILLTILLWGSGLIVYVVLWIVVPIAKTPAQKCEMRGLEPTAENMSRFSEYKK